MKSEIFLKAAGAGKEKGTMKKCYILDTNILESTAGSILDGLDDNDIVITMTTLDELDNHKKALGEHGYSARESLRKIFAFTEQKKGNYETGYATKNGGTFRIEKNHCDGECLKGDWDMSKPDNKILSAAAYLTKASKIPVILITNDSGMFVSAKLAGIKVQTYRNETIETEELYTGRAELEVSTKAINLLYADKEYKGVPAEKVIKKKDLEGLYCNEYLTLHCGSSSELCRLDNLGTLHRIKDTQVYGGIRGQNAGQKFLIDALMNEVAPLVIVQGSAGTGKTLLSLACGLDKTHAFKRGDGRYDSVVITRSNTLSDEDVGFLPGSLEEKMGPLVAPFIDSLRVIVKQGEKEEKKTVSTQINDLFTTGTIEITSIAYMRGRSLSNSFIIISEAQNLTISQAKTLSTRVGLSSTIIFEGDVSQIDKPTLSKRSNGLVYLSEKFKGNPLCAQIAMKDSECVRSELAAEASRIL